MALKMALPPLPDVNTSSHLEEVVVDRINSVLEGLEQEYIFEKGDNLKFKVLYFRCWQDIYGNIPTEEYTCEIDAI